MEAERDFDAYSFKVELEAELENIASGLRKLIDQEIVSFDSRDFGIDSPLPEDEISTASSVGSIKRLFEEHQDTSNASSTNNLDWRPLFDSVEDVNSKDESTSSSELNSRRLFENEAKASLGDLGTRRLFKEEKDVAESLSDLGMKMLFKDDQESLSNLGMERLFKEGKVTAESVSNLGMERLFKEGKATAESLSDLGMKVLFNQSEDHVDSATLKSAKEVAAIANKYAEIRARKKLVAKRRLFIGPLNKGETRRRVHIGVRRPLRLQSAEVASTEDEEKVVEKEKNSEVKKDEEAKGGEGSEIDDDVNGGEEDGQKKAEDEGASGEESAAGEESATEEEEDNASEVAADDEDESDYEENAVADDKLDMQHEAFTLLEWLFSFVGKIHGCYLEEAEDIEETVGVRDFLNIFFVFLTLFVVVALALHCCQLLRGVGF